MEVDAPTAHSKDNRSEHNDGTGDERPGHHTASTRELNEQTEVELTWRDMKETICTIYDQTTTDAESRN